MPQLLGVDGARWPLRTSNPLCLVTSGVGGFDSLALPPVISDSKSSERAWDRVNHKCPKPSSFLQMSTDCPRTFSLARWLGTKRAPGCYTGGLLLPGVWALRVKRHRGQQLRDRLRRHPRQGLGIVPAHRQVAGDNFGQNLKPFMLLLKGCWDPRGEVCLRSDTPGVAKKPRWNSLTVSWTASCGAVPMATFSRTALPNLGISTALIGRVCHSGGVRSPVGDSPIDSVSSCITEA